MSEFKGLFVVQLVDSVSYGPPAGGTDVFVEVEGAVKKPLRKPNGMFVFTDVPPGPRRVFVRAGRYHVQSFTVSAETLNPKYPVVVVPLAPLPSYPFGDGVTLVRASVRDSAGRVMAGVPVRAVVVSDVSARARLAKDAPSGSLDVSLARVAGRLQVGERLWLPGESCIVYEVGADNRSFSLQEPLANAFKRQSKLMPCVESQSDERGEVVLPFGNCRSAAFDVQVQVLQGKSELKEVRVEEGRTMNLGVITIEP
ncbi:hypothetical protein JJB07_16025 [Tumebacillus sp. ITR2]|uniref:Carboxypeptidase regulatory-like domain-containing protein n=1 Tax=Tumebacillus amylolyticus TaxID=2801339 RepID=A0ABS1JD08_9BACL|nr:hypothetical protein [Tumebacillus amylolyticus]MBL0388125.1 hypothetical protein [Tumebacillus amylolyticus]